MRALRKVIAAHENELKRHRLFELLEESQTLRPVSRMARALAFWPMIFQDVLRLTAEQARGSDFEQFAVHGRDESSGHDNWYVGDLHMLGVTPPTFEELFSIEHRPIRDACYALLSEVHLPQSAAQRVAFLTALEPTGRVFFERVSDAIARLDETHTLRYFTRPHLIAERDHDLSVELAQAELHRIVLSDAERTQCEAMVARVYRAFSEAFTHLAQAMENGSRVPLVSDVRELNSGTTSPAVKRRVAGT